MSKMQTPFFATREDLIGILEAVAEKKPFSLAGIYGLESSVSPTYKSVSEIEDLSISVYADHNREKSYLLIKPSSTPKLGEKEMRKGGINRYLDQSTHPESVFLRPGGVYGNVECIVAGSLGTISSDLWSLDLYKICSSEIRKKFRKIKSYYVGKEAQSHLKRGVRLTTSIRYPEEYDLSV